MRTILILGAGIMQVPAIRIARRKGWRVVVADGNPSAMARDMADVFATVDLKDRDGLVRLAEECRGNGGLDGIFTAGTDFSSSVAWVAERLGLPGIGFETAMRATDKVLMREALAKAGVPSPAFALWTGDRDPRSLLGGPLDFPLVVKPVDNMGARGVRRVDDPEGLVEACARAIELSRTRRVIVERFMVGPELSLDAVVAGGAVTVCGVADRHIFFPPSFVEMGHTMPTSLDAATTRRIEEVFIAGIHALGIDNGAAKGDIKLTREGPMVGEIAARLSGGYMSGWTFPLSSGVEVTEAALNVAVGLAPGDLTPTLRRTSAERALISIPGVVDAVIGVEEARRLPGVVEVFMRVKPGDEVVFPSNNVEKCGNVIAVADTRAEAVALAEGALAGMLVRLRPLTDRTTRYLFEESGNDAFEGYPPTAVDALPVTRGEPAGLSPDDPVPVLPLPSASAQTTDWYGGSLDAAARSALHRGNGRLDGGDGGFALGRLFWRAITRAGTQGGVYVLDSVREAARRGRLKELIAAL
ncbi:MAG TPA: ATP-grasp domain-containing protein [Spirochaetia bacterium]